MGLWTGTPLEIKHPKAGFGTRGENRPSESSLSTPLCPRHCRVPVLPTTLRGSRLAEDGDVNQSVLACKSKS